MSTDWDAINDNLNKQLSNENLNLLQKKFRTADGREVEYRDFGDIAKMNTIARNEAALEARNTNGIVMRMERDYSDL